MKYAILMTLFVTAVASASAQPLTPTRKVLYLQTDKQVYQPDETIWFKAYVANVSGIGLDTTIQNLYVDIYDASRKLVAHQKYITFLSMAKGQFQIPKGSKDERFWLVAYRRNDVQRDPDNYYSRMVRVFRGKDLPASAMQTPRTEPTAPSKLFLKPDGQDLIISFHNDDKANDSILLRIVKDHQPFFEQGYALGGKTRLFIRYPLAELPDGLCTISLASPTGAPIEERSILVKDPSKTFRPQLVLDTLDLASNGANVWRVQGLGDANLSVSIIDAELPIDPYGLPYQVMSRSTILGSSPLLADALRDTASISDITGTFMAAPARIENADTTRPPLDRLITLRGKVVKIDPRKGKDFLPSKMDLEFYHDKKQSGRIRSFIINDTLLREGELFYFDTSYVRGYVMREGDVDPNYKVIFDTVYRPYVLSPMLTDEDAPPATPTLLANLVEYHRGGQAWDSAAKALTLNTVVVKASYQDKVRMADQLYTSNYFTARDAFSILVEEDSAFRNVNYEVGQYVASHSPGLLYHPMQDATYIARQYNTPSPFFQFAWARNPGVMLYLNESPVPYEVIQELPRENISYIKIMRGNWQGPFAYTGPAIAFYTKKSLTSRWDVVKKDLTKLNNGYTQAENFDNLQAASKFSQWSSTLYWNPDLNSRKDDGGFTIRFRNNTVAHRFRIVIEGLTYEGRPVRFEKVVERK
jgi:hypothetical protein